MTGSDGVPTNQHRLDSWKEIGTHFGRDERTVKRWERERGLPVHRVPGSGRGRVYAYPTELAEWLQGAGAALAGEGFPSDIVPRPPPADPSSGVMTAAEATELHNRAEFSAKPPGSSYPSLGFRASGDSSARMPDSAPRLSLVHSATPAADRMQPAPTSPRQEVAIAAQDSSSAALAPTTELPAPRSHAKAWWIAGFCLLIGMVCAGEQWFHLARLHRADAMTSTAANAQAENLYLQGKFFWQERTPESLTKAVDLFTQAIVHDPNYAPAYAGLAECYEMLREFSNMPDAEAFPRALSAAQQAVRLNPNLAQGHAALAFAQFYWTWDTPGALREFARALELDPNAAQTHHWYATSLITLGRGEEALEQIDRAQQLDPGSRAIVADKGLILHMMGRTDEARALLLQVEQSNPRFVSPHQYLADIAWDQGDGEGYAREMRQVASLLNDPERAQLADLAENAYHSGGPAAMAKAQNDHIRELYNQGKQGPLAMARVLAQDGNPDGAFKLLDLAYARRDPGLRGLLLDPAWAPYRADPRFVAIESKLGMPSVRLRAE